jgi:hypothetical protein
VTTTNRRLAFSTGKYPTFGRGAYSEDNPPRTVTDSPYYWWFKFLQLSTDYTQAVKKPRGSGLSELVSDFGDVANTDFKTWWRGHSHLFAENPNEYQMMVANKPSDLAPFNNPGVINLVVPLNWTSVGLKRRFSEIISRYDVVKKTERGLRIHESSARYRLGRRWNTEGFKNAYRIYVERQRALKESHTRGKKTPWADIAIRARLPAAIGLREGETSRTLVDQRQILTVLALRHYKNATEFIRDSASDRFPSVNGHAKSSS